MKEKQRELLVGLTVRIMPNKDVEILISKDKLIAALANIPAGPKNTVRAYARERYSPHWENSGLTHLPPTYVVYDSDTPVGRVDAEIQTKSIDENGDW